MADANWLFSSSAQSAAAVFAIVAGFVTTRILTLSAERRGLVAQITELRVQLQDVLGRESAFRSERTQRVLGRAAFRMRHMLYAERRPNLNDMLEHVSLDFVSPEEAQEELVELLNAWDKAKSFFHLNEGFIRADSPKDVKEWLANLRTNADGFDEEMMAHLYNGLLEEQRAKVRAANPLNQLLGYSNPIDIAALFPSPSAQPRADPVVELTAKIEIENAQALLLEKRIESAKARAFALTMPRSAWYTILILVYLATTCVILPLAFLPVEKNEAWMTPLVVGLLALGLIGFVIYIFLESWAMRQPPDVQDL